MLKARALLLPLLLSLSGLAAADDAVDLRVEEKPAPVVSAQAKRRAKRENEKYEAQRAKESAARLEERLKSLSPETQRLVKYLAGQPVERCGLCGNISVDAGGLNCVEQVGKSLGKCGNACQEKIVLVPAFALADKGFTPAPGGLASGKETLDAAAVEEALQIAQMKRGFSRRSFMGPPILTCR
jgi:hypothetical protein